MRRVVFVVVIIVIAILGVLLANSANKTSENQTTTTQKNETSTKTETSSSSKCPTPAAKTVSYCDGKISDVTVSVGDTLTFKNDSDKVVNLDSDPHPQHTSDPELNVGTIEPGQSKTVAVTKAGTWGIHNHLNSSERGTVTVK